MGRITTCVLFKAFIYFLFLLFPAVIVVADEEKQIVKEIQIKGLLTIPEQEIRTKLKTKEQELFSSHLLKDDIQKLYSLGYFSNIEVQSDPLPSGLKVTFLVTENQLLGDVKIVGNSYMGTQELLESLRIARERFLAPYALSLDIIHLREMYQKKGFQFVNVRSELKANGGWADVYFHIDEGPRVYIYEINFFGNRTFSKREIVGFIQTQESGFFSSTYYDEDTFQEDLILIRNFYRSEGFLDVRVYVRDYFLANDRSSITLNISIDEGPRYLVKAVRIENKLGENLLFTEQELFNRMEVKAGLPFKQNDLLLDKSKIERLYGENGFLNVRVAPIITYPDLQNPVVDILYKIEENTSNYIRKMDVEGNPLTRDDVVRREILINPGEQFNLGKIQETQQRIRRLQYFENIKLDLNDTDDDGWKDLLIQVEEGRTGSLRFAAGITSDLGPVGEIVFNKRNFNLARFPRSFQEFLSGESFTGGGQNLDIYFQVGRDILRSRISFTEPYFLGYNLLFGTELYKTERARESWTEADTGAQISLGRRLNPDTVLRLTYRIENLRVHDVDNDAPRDVFAVKGDNLLSVLGLEFTIDTRDDYILPSRGYTIGLSYDIAGVFLGGDHDFSRGNVRLAWFQPIYTLESGSKHVLSLGVRAGFMGEHHPSTSVPIFERFFAGGATSIRGFEFRSVGPKENGDPLGGEFMVLGTVEYGFPLYQDVVRMVLFVDAGNVIPEINSDIWDTMRVSLGFGFRLKIPMLGPAPFAFDFGFPIRDEDDDDRQVFSFSLGKPL